VATAEVDEGLRRDTQRNHTATHLLHAALRSVLGDHVHQAGSLVAPDRLRFDFNHRGPLSVEDRRAIERIVNQGIWANVPVVAGRESYREALASGAMALFGEKYEDEVRVIRLPGVSAELCGGCHVRSTGEIGLFKITHETGVAAGIRRIEAVTGPEAFDHVEELEELVKATSDTLGVQPDKLAERAVSLVAEHKVLKVDAAAKLDADATVTASGVVERALEVDGGRILAQQVDLPAGTDLTAFGDSIRQELGSGVAIVHVTVAAETGDDGGSKEAFLSVVTDDWVKRGVKAGDLVRLASKTTGSGGGGRPHLAQGGVGDRELVPQALEAALDLATRTVAK
jgi:alanyl-tRNA synthetase